jgi:hypothetical protein
VAWETRKNGRQYFYLSERRPDGSVRKRYLGKWVRAEVESIRLEKKVETRRRIKEERQRTAPAEVLLKQQIRSTSDLTHALMLSNGFTNEKSRGWRPLPMVAAQEANPDQTSDLAENKELSFEELAAAARRSDRSVLPALRNVMQEHPELAENNGDLASGTQIHWIDLIAGRDLFRRQCLLIKVGKFKRELLAGAGGAAVGQMLVDLAISTWLQLNYHEDREATRPAENIQLSEFRLKKIESAFNRHLRSLKGLTALQAVNFSNRMAEVMNSPIPDRDGEHSSSSSRPASAALPNRLRDSFRRVFEPVPMNN